MRKKKNLDLLNDMVITAPVQAETIFSKDDDPVGLINFGFLCSTWSSDVKLTPEAIVSLMMTKRSKKKEEEKQKKTAC